MEHFPMYATELKGLAAAFNRTDVTYEYLAAWVYFHELSHGDYFETPLQYRECTGIIVHGPNGTVL